MVGEPRVHLYVPLKDWLHHYYNGQYGRQFNTLYYQWALIAKEFLHMYIHPSLTMTHSFTHILFLMS